MGILKSTRRIVGAVGAILVLLIGGAAVIGTIQEARWRADRRREAMRSYVSTSTRYEINANMARISAGTGRCRDGLVSFSGVTMCDSQDVRMAERAFYYDCIRCVPEGAPSGTCARVERALALQEIHDNPCEK